MRNLEIRDEYNTECFIDVYHEKKVWFLNSIPSSVIEMFLASMGLSVCRISNLGIRVYEGKESDTVRENNDMCGASGSWGYFTLVTGVREELLEQVLP